MKRYMELLCCLLCLLMVASVALTGCDGDERSTDDTSDSIIDGTESDTEQNKDTDGEGGDDIRDISEDLIADWDFIGLDKEEMLTDKSVSGRTVEYISLVGDGAYADITRLNIDDGEGNYAAIGNANGSDLYDLSGKTIVIKAKMSNTGEWHRTAGIIGKASTFDLYFSSDDTDRKICFRYKKNGDWVTEETATPSTMNVWRVFALSFDVDEASNTATVRLYRSKNDSPEKARDFELIFKKEIQGITEDIFKGSDPIYIGKRSDHKDSARGMNSQVCALKIYNSILTTEELASIRYGGNKESQLAALESLINDAQSISKTVHSDEEWQALQQLLNTARALNAESEPESIEQTVAQLADAIKNISVVYPPEKIGDLEKIEFNNPDIATPIYVGYRSYPGIYDIDGDGKMDLLVTGNGRSYSGKNGGAMIAFRNRNQSAGGTVFEQAELYLDNNTFPLYSYKTDGSSVFVNEKGQMFTELSRNGYGEPQIFSKLKGHFKLYDVDGDGVSDAVFASTKTNGDNNYDEQGNSLEIRTSTMYWIRNTGSEDKPVFLGEPQPFRFEDNEVFSVSDISQSTDIRTFSMFDWDGDGDMDLIAGGWINEFYYYENVGGSIPTFKKKGVLLETESGPMKLDCIRYNVINYDWDGDGKDDLIMGSDSGDVIYFRFTGRFNDKTGAPVFEEQKNFCAKNGYLAVSSLSRPTACDFDGDGDVDLIVGESGGHLYYIENISNGTEISWALPVKLTDENGNALEIKAGYNESLQGTRESAWGYTIPVACDWDGDGDVDVIANSVTGRVVWFENIGTPTKPQLTQPKPIEVEWKNKNLYPAVQWWTPDGKELVTQHRTTPYAVDLNGDGLCDLVMLDHEGYLAFFERYEENGVLKLKQGERIFLDSSGAPLKLGADPGTGGTNDAGAIGRRKIAIVDWDNDGKLDLLVDDENATLYRTTKIVNGKYYMTKSGAVAKGNISGHNPGFTVVDYNNDGKPDIIFGTETGYLYYYQHK